MDTSTKKLRDEYLDWALSHSLDNIKVYERKPDRFRFDSDLAIGELNFFDLEMYVVELRITECSLFRQVCLPLTMRLLSWNLSAAAGKNI